MKVKDCMCHEVAYLTPDSTIEDCAKLTCNKHIGCVPICDTNKTVVGLVTDRDVILRSIACDKDIKNTPISDIMTRNVCTCNQNDNLTNAQVQMSKNQIRRLPVCDENNQIVGMLTFGDLAQNDIEIGKHEVSATIRNICSCNGQTKNAE